MANTLARVYTKPLSYNQSYLFEKCIDKRMVF